MRPHQDRYMPTVPSSNNVHSNNLRLSDYAFDLPDELIAQKPLSNRSDSRLMVVDGQCANASPFSHHGVRDLPQLLKQGDHLVFNDTRVVPARVFGVKATGGKLELMLERVDRDGCVLAKIRASKSPQLESIIVLHSDRSAAPLTIDARVIGRVDDLFKLQAATGPNDALSQFIEQHGEIPLPPYIGRSPDGSDRERYQTVYSKNPGAVAAPTAGLHFDTALFEALNKAGITHSFITLHVGAGTFQPVRVDNVAEHVMHAERVSVGQDTVDAVAQAQQRQGRVIAVGTTCVRALESASCASNGTLETYVGETRLFLTPGAQFQVVDGLFTNFHLPESTLLMLVAAFAGHATTMAAYRQAVAHGYRFFSYGDAMLLWPQLGVRP